MGSERVDDPVMKRGEIDTSLPFKSVKEAADLFGGMAFWKPSSIINPLSHHDQVKEHAAATLETELMMKEKEILDILNQLETTKTLVQQLKLKLLQKEASETSNENVGSLQCPGSVLVELKHAKSNLTRTTNDVDDIRATIDLYNREIEKHRMSLDKTCQRLFSNTSKITCLEKELNQTKQKLELVKDGTELQDSSHDHPFSSITRELQKLSFETEQFKKVGESARSQVLRAMSEIEETKSRIKTAEIGLVAAEKMTQAARASEALAIAEIKALSNCAKKSGDVTLTVKEYSSLISKAQEAERACNNSGVDLMLQVDEATLLWTEILKKIDDASEEVEISKRDLEEALCTAEAANRGKLAVEEALWKWRSSDNGQRRRSSVHSSTKFKNFHPSLHRKDSYHRLQVNDLINRQVLPREDYENEDEKEKSMDKTKLSVSQIHNMSTSAKNDGKENTQAPAKRKRFSFARISLFLKKHSQRKNKQTTTSMCGGAEI